MSFTDPNFLATALVHLHAGLYFQTAAFVVLVYDHLLTFADEVERVWKQKISGASILFFLNRYGTLFVYIINIDAFQGVGWTKEACGRFVKFEGASGMVLIAVCQLIMFLRVYALYGRSTPVIAFLLCILVVQLSVSGVGLHRGFVVPLPPGVPGCILTGTNPLFGALWVAPLATDTCIFILTIWKTRQYIKEGGRSPTLDIFARDGAMYFCVIFGSNMLNTLFYFLAPGDLKAVGASFNQLITSVMISRLVLNLRSPSESSTSHIKSRGSRLRDMDIRKRFGDTGDLLTMTIGNLGENFQHYQDTDP